MLLAAKNTVGKEAKNKTIKREKSLQIVNVLQLPRTYHDIKNGLWEYMITCMITYLHV